MKRLSVQKLQEWVDEVEIPPLKTAGQTRSDEKYYFKKMQGLLCKNAVVVNLPRKIVSRLFGSSDVVLRTTAVSEIAEVLNGKITARYSPAWQLRSWVEGVLTRALHMFHRYEFSL